VRPAADQLEHLLKPLDMLLRLVSVRQERLFSSADFEAFAILGRFFRI
jgi:hypothetical protein